jgi:hypothetical protein
MRVDEQQMHGLIVHCTACERCDEWIVDGGDGQPEILQPLW